MPLVDRQLFLRRSPKYFPDHTIFRRSHNFPGSFPQLLQRSYNYTGNFSTIPHLRSPVRSDPPAVARQLRFPLSRSRTIHSPLMPPCNAPKSFHIFARRQIILYVYARRQIISFRTPPNHFETYSAESFQTKKRPRRIAEAAGGCQFLMMYFVLSSSVGSNRFRSINHVYTKEGVMLVSISR